MRIAVINLTGGGMSGGYRTYLRNVLPRLAAHPNVEAILCAVPLNVRVKSRFLPIPKVSFIPCAPFRFMSHRPDRALKQAVARFAPDVIFIPVERYLRFPGIPLVVMPQNMGPLAPVAGNPLSERIRYVAQRHETRIALRHADRVIVPTNFVREFLTERWRIPTQKVTTVHYGSNETSESLIPQKPVAIPDGWAGKFLFTAGSIEPYRGLEDVLRAMQYLRNDANLAGLVIAGEARWNMVGYQKRLQRGVARRELHSMVCWTGALSEEEMAWCYRNCRIFVMTSRIESFGMIGLEALSHGCVCIAADNPPLPEIFGEAASYYTPGDGKGLAHTIEAAFARDPAQRQAAAKHVQERTDLFSWDANVEQLLEVLKTVSHKKQGAQTDGPGS